MADERTNFDDVYDWFADKFDGYNDDGPQMDSKLRKEIVERFFPAKEKVESKTSAKLDNVKKAVEKGQESKFELADVKLGIAQTLSEALKGKPLTLTGKLDKQSCQKQIFDVLKSNGFNPNGVEEKDKEVYLNSLAFALTTEIYNKVPGLEQVYKENPEANFDGILDVTVSAYLMDAGINVEVKPDEKFKKNMVAFSAGVKTVDAEKKEAGKETEEKKEGEKAAEEKEEVDPKDDGLAQVMADFLVSSPTEIFNKISNQEAKDLGALKEMVKKNLKLNFQSFLLKKNVPGAPNLEVLGTTAVEQQQTFDRIKPLISDKLVAAFLAPGGLIANGFVGYDLKVVEKINSGENKSDKLGYKVSFDGTNFSVVFNDQAEFDAAYKTASENVNQPALSVDANKLKNNFLVRFLAGFFGVKTDADWNQVADANSGHPMQYLLGALSVVGGQKQFAVFADKWTGLKEQYGDSQYLGGPIKYVEGMIASNLNKKKGGVMDLVSGVTDNLKKGQVYLADLLKGKSDFVPVEGKALELTEAFEVGQKEILTMKVPKGVEVVLGGEVKSLVKVDGGAVDWKKIGEGTYKLPKIPEGSVLAKGVELKIDKSTS